MGSPDFHKESNMACSHCSSAHNADFYSVSNTCEEAQWLWEMKPRDPHFDAWQFRDWMAFDLGW